VRGHITKRIVKDNTTELVQRATIDLDFLLLIVFAAAICALGFKMNNASAIVGAMIISPLMYSILSASIASYNRDWLSFKKSILTFATGTFVAILTSILVGFYYSTSIRSEISGRIAEAPLDYFLIAIFCGLGGTYAFFSPKTHQAVGGIAISVALLPPIIMSGIGLGIGITEQNIDLAVSSSKIVLSNLLGIYLGSLVMIIFLNRISKD